MTSLSWSTTGALVNKQKLIIMSKYFKLSLIFNGNWLIPSGHQLHVNLFQLVSGTTFVLKHGNLEGMNYWRL